jgi:dTDP-4-dehydrorhamnose 3,5-epimerase
MQIVETGIKDLIEIQPKVFGDKRGYFFESFRQDTLDEYFGRKVEFVQDNQSFSTKGVLRGLHFQKGDYSQGKLVRVSKGKVLDVAVDLRKESPTFGKSYSLVLDSEINNMLFVPKGFAHGFYTIEDAIFQYKCTNYYNPKEEAGVIWNDSDLAIDWNTSNPLVSEKDNLLPSFQELAILINSDEIKF